MKTISNINTNSLLLEETIYRNLLKEVHRNNKTHPAGTKHLKLDVTLFFVHLISLREIKAKDKSEHGYVPLKAEYLKKYHHQYKVYFKFLEDHEFIRVQTYSIYRQQSKRYKLVKPGQITSFVSHALADFVLKKKVQESNNQKRLEAIRTTGHLTKWLTPDHLKINYKEAVEYINSSQMALSKKYIRRYLVEMINGGHIYFQRDGKDNRLHSILTNMPKDIRPFLKYQESSLVCLDIKNSQPYMLAGFLNIIQLEDKKKLDKLISYVIKKYRKVIKDIVTVMIQESVKEVDIRGIRDYIKLISEGNIYEFIGNHFPENFKNKIQTPLAITDKFYNKRLGFKTTEHFTSMREYAKRAMLEYLYCSPVNKERRYLEIKKIMPEAVNKIVDRFKEDDKNIFPIFLQNLESYLILDTITRKISIEHPEIPLYTIHDSIITTPQHASYVREQMKIGLEYFFGIAPIISVENDSLPAEAPP